MVTAAVGSEHTTTNPSRIRSANTRTLCSAWARAVSRSPWVRAADPLARGRGGTYTTIPWCRSTATPGLAPGCSLVAVRIAKGDGDDGWVFDDFKTADAVDFAWKEGKADVLSNSWGGGPPVDAITRALERARTRGRGGQGRLVAVATGNSDGPLT